MIYSDGEQKEHTQDMNQTDEMRAASERHQVSMCKEVITQSYASATLHTVAMRDMT